MPAILLFGIYSGVTTPTEAAAIAALYALLIAGGLYRALKLRSLYMFLSKRTLCGICWSVIGSSMILTYVVVQEDIPQAISGIFESLSIVSCISNSVNVLVLLLGCVSDATVIILVIVPLFLTCKRLGLIWSFRVLIVVNSMIGLITPPYGILLFVINAVTGIPLKDIIAEIWAFLAIPSLR